MRVFRYRENFDLEARFSTWLYTIALNLARDRLRRRARRPETLSLEANDDADLGDFEETLVDPKEPPDQALVNQEWWGSLERAVAELPESLRQAVVLFAGEDQSHAQIASETGCTPKAVELRLYHARKLLRRIVKKNCPVMRDSFRRGVVDYEV